jgi:nucleoside 2-deoxyribosyltransferase
MPGKVFTSGPITGLSYGDATNWREYVREQLAPYNIEAVSPLRHKEYLTEELSIEDRYEKSTLSTAKAISYRDRFDALRCDVVLTNVLGTSKVSIGTMIETGIAAASMKPNILVIENESNIHHHAMLETYCGWVVPTLDEGIEVVKALLL